MPGQSFHDIRFHYRPRLWDYLCAHTLVVGLRRHEHLWRIIFSIVSVFIAASLMLKGFHFVALGIVAVVIYAMFKAECRLIADYFINPHFKEASTIVLTQYGVSIEGTRAQFLPWDHFREYKHNTHMLVMLMGKRASLIVPFALIPPEDKARLITFVDEKLSGFPSLISAEGAYFALQAGEAVKFIDASWYMPQEKRKAKEEYAQEHLPGAVFFDIDEIKADSPLPHMLPDAEQFAQAMQALGISNNDKIVVYDGAGLFSAARLWWMLRYFGHENVAVMDGGLPRWKLLGLPLVSEVTEVSPATFVARPNPALLRSFDAMVTNQVMHEEQVADARSPARFSGQEQDPRPGVRSGHIPGSCNLYYKSLLQEDGRMKLNQELQRIIEAAGIRLDAPVIATCGSGVTACILVLAFEQLGKKNVAVYDGSWAEWGTSTQAVAP